MKKTILSLALLFLFGSMLIFAQEETEKEVGTEQKTEKPEKNQDEIKTLFRDKSKGHYIGLSFNYVEIEEQHGMQFGLRGGWIAGKSLAIGLGAKVFFNESKEDPLYIGEQNNLIGGYGGLLIEPIILPRFPVHISFPVLTGVGGIGYTKDVERFTESSIEDSDFFLVIEPGVELEFNILKHFRLAAGIYYTLTSDIKLEYDHDGPYPPGVTKAIVNPNVLRGLNFGVTLKFGSF